MAMKGSSRIVRVLAPTLLVAAAGYIGMGCAPAAPTQVPPNNYFNPANNATLTSMPGLVTVVNLSSYTVCYTVNGIAPRLTGSNCTFADQKLPSTSQIALNRCGANTVQLAWQSAFGGKP